MSILLFFAFSFVLSIVFFFSFCFFFCPSLPSFLILLFTLPSLSSSFLSLLQIIYLHSLCFKKPLSQAVLECLLINIYLHLISHVPHLNIHSALARDGSDLVVQIQKEVSNCNLRSSFHKYLAIRILYSLPPSTDLLVFHPSSTEYSCHNPPHSLLHATISAAWIYPSYPHPFGLHMPETISKIVPKKEA